MTRRKKVIVGILGSFLTLGVAVHFGVMHIMNMHVFDANFVYEDFSKTKMSEIYSDSHVSSHEKAVDSAFIPFREVSPFDADAHTWSNLFSHSTAGGITIFDANGDGRPDVYLSKDGNNWVRPTDKNGVLESEPRHQRNMLYLNLGNDDQGNPVFKSVDQVMENNEYVEEELLVENFLFPRRLLSDSVENRGRMSALAVSADFNADGRADLLIGNGLPGMAGSHEKTYLKVDRFASPIGRTASKTRQTIPAQGLYFVEHQVRDNRDDEIQSSRGMEMMGANTLLLNMGDKDGDGIPEWQDASRSAKIEGRRNTVSLSVADIDLDGDLDVFEANIADMDFWAVISLYWSGAVNQLYINQLAETGELKFVESSEQMQVSGLYTDENPPPGGYRVKENALLSNQYALLTAAILGDQVMAHFVPDLLEINGQQAENAGISWASVFQDVNDDGYPDLWVANDFDLLRLYINKQGRSFEERKNVRSGMKGNWMSMSPADYNVDAKEDLFAGSFGGSLSVAAIFPSVETLTKPSLDMQMTLEFLQTGTANFFHAIVDGSDVMKPLLPQITHSKTLPPDTTLKPNKLKLFPELAEKYNYQLNGLAPYEFSWGSVAFDVQNDGKPDLYFTGTLYGRGGSLFSTVATNPGRLLVNTTESPDQLSFVDLTAEHHLFNIEELDYSRLNSDGYIYRKAPTQNWSKRDTVYSYDATTSRTTGASDKDRIVNQDLIQTAENSKGVIAADLNNDGFKDLMIRNIGGYDSRSSKATNLKVQLSGESRAIPSHNYNFPSPTNFEPGRTRVFINQYADNHWLKVRLINDSPSSFNRNAIGARVVVNNKLMQIKRSGSGGYLSNVDQDLLFGLGNKVVNQIVVHWPDAARTKTELALNSFYNGTLTISKQDGQFDWVGSSQ